MVGAIKGQASAALVNQLAAALDLDFVMPDDPDTPAPGTRPLAPC